MVQTPDKVHSFPETIDPAALDSLDQVRAALEKCLGSRYPEKLAILKVPLLLHQISPLLTKLQEKGQLDVQDVKPHAARIRELLLILSDFSWQVEKNTKSLQEFDEAVPGIAVMVLLMVWLATTFIGETNLSAVTCGRAFISGLICTGIFKVIDVAKEKIIEHKIASTVATKSPEIKASFDQQNNELLKKFDFICKYKNPQEKFKQEVAELFQQLDQGFFENNGSLLITLRTILADSYRYPDYNRYPLLTDFFRVLGTSPAIIELPTELKIVGPEIYAALSEFTQSYGRFGDQIDTSNTVRDVAEDFNLFNFKTFKTELVNLLEAIYQSLPNDGPLFHRQLWEFFNQRSSE